VKLIRPRPDDFFFCQMYLFDREMWEEEMAGPMPLSASRLHLCEERVKQVIQYYESFGFQFEPPDFWITRGQMAHLVDSGTWVPLGEFSGYPPNVSTATC
jgi:hypothetical protein